MVPSYPRTPHWPESLKVHRDDLYHQNPEWFLEKPLVITEKLDGGVTEINQGEVYARSTDQPTHEPWFSYVKSVTLPKLYGVPPHLVVTGEDLYGIHSIEYDPLPDSFFLFHVLDLNTMTYWAWDAVVEFALEYGLRHVPVLHRGTFSTVREVTEFFMRNVKEPSVYGPAREGFVMRDEGPIAYDAFGTHVCKFVRANHVQTDEHWKLHWRPAKIAR